MANYFPFNKDNSDEARILRRGLDGLRDSRDDLRRSLASMNQATDQQGADRWGLYPSTSGGTDQVTQYQGLKAELLSDMAALEGITVQIDQLLAKTG